MRRQDKYRSILKANLMVEQSIIKEYGGNDFNDQANVLVTKIGNDRRDVDSNQEY